MGKYFLSTQDVQIVVETRELVEAYFVIYLI